MYAASDPQRLTVSSNALRKARSRISAGNSSGTGICAPFTRTGVITISRLSAVSISIADVIAGTVQPTLSLVVLVAGPVLVDDDEHDVADRKCLVQLGAEVAPQRNAVHIHEDGAFAEPAREVLEDGARLAGAVCLR